ncbi:MAG: pentapeptide repeat-containing protein [Caldilineaceae bacterium]
MTANKSPQPPRLPKVRSTWPERPIALQDLDEFSALTLTASDLCGQQATHLTWRGVLWSQVRSAGSQFEGVRLTDVALKGCDLANAQWERLTAQRLAFEECQLIGFDAPDARWQDVTFTRCRGQYAKFRFSKFKQVCFEQCDLRNADFQGSDLSGVIFNKCDLTDAQLSGTTLSGTDFRGSTIERMKVGIAELPGAIVEPVQAAYVAGLLGVVVKWAGEE